MARMTIPLVDSANSDFLGLLVTADTNKIDDSGRLPDPENLTNIAAELMAIQVIAGALDVELQDSFDGGFTWANLLTFTQVTAGGQSFQRLALPRPPGNLIRARRVASTGTWQYRVILCADPSR